MNVLFTGGTGFIGKNVIPILEKVFVVFAPNRKELNLFDQNEVKKYVQDKKIDVIVHAANPNPSRNTGDIKENMLRESLQMFFTVIQCKNIVKKIIYLGSGAVYGKDKDIIKAKEEEMNNYIPKDDYGFAKYIMNDYAHDNIYNLCLFGCYGPGDAESKFITHCIRCCRDNTPITIRKNCYFDYLHVYDVGYIICWIIGNDVKYNSYNVCSGIRISLFDIACKVKEQMKSNQNIVLLSSDINFEYTASNQRLRNEYKLPFLSLEDGIKTQIDYEVSR